MMLLQQVLETKELAVFVNELLTIKNEENMWEFYLHRVFDKSFEEFLDDNRVVEVPEANLEATVKHSFEMLNNFQPT